MLYTEYTYILFYFIISLLLSGIIFIVSFLLAFQKPETEKMSAYECGFEPYDGARKKIDVKFYIFAMLFVIFDIETMFLLPWTITLSRINYIGFWVMVDFLFELSIGILYIWIAGGLNMENN
jgi:NADH:ubiquinone oxidoreductase subunit 3 (subunit A)